MKITFSSTRFVILTAGCALTFAGVARGGSFSANFDDGAVPLGSSIYGDAATAINGGVGDSGVLMLTTAAFNQTGSFIIDDLDPGSRIASFVATFSLRMGGGTATPGDGFSFNFATDLPNSSFDEEGAGSGLTITFDTYDNSFGDNTEGPEIRIKYAGNLVARRKISNQFHTDTNFVPVVVTYTPAGTLTLVYNNLVLYTNTFVFGPMGPGARFGFSGRCGGGANETHYIDDLSITTAAINGFYIKGQVTPYPPIGISGANTFQVVLQDSGGTVDPNSVSMTFNGAPVAPTISKPASVTTISYAPPSLLLPSSVNHLAVDFTVSSSPVTLLYDFAVTNGPLWNLAPGSRIYLPPDPDLAGGSTPLYRTVAYNALSNHLYVVCRTNSTGNTTNPSGLTINVLDAITGAHLHELLTNGIPGNNTDGGNFPLMNMAVADDGAIYAANVVANATTFPLTVYCWTNGGSVTAPIVVFSGDPGVGVTGGASGRWGDSLAVRGSGVDTRILLDCNAKTISAVLAPTDSYRTNFTATTYSHTYAFTTTAIGRGLGFGPTNTYYLKKRVTGNTPPVSVRSLQLIRFDTAPNTTLILSNADYYPQVGPVTVDWSRGMAAGILFVTNFAIPDRLIIYDVSNLASPLDIAEYNFPTNHQKNANFIGEIVFGPDKIFAVDGNNGIMAVPIAPPTAPTLKIALAGGSVVLSWINTVPGFVLQSTPSLVPTTWNPVAQPAVENGNLNIVTDTLGGGPQFYRLVK
jgi:hypothetical protein